METENQTLQGIPIQQMIRESLKMENESREKKDTNCWFVSGIGSCMRGMYLQRMGIQGEPIDQRTLQVFDMGNIQESLIIKRITDWIEKKGLYTIETQIRVQNESLDVRGRLDILMTRIADNFKQVVEVKSKHSDSFWHMDRKGPQREHQYQLWLYLYMLKIPYGTILYVSKDDQSMREYPVRLDDKSIETEVMNYLNQLNDCWKRKILPPLPDSKSWQSKYCKVHKECLRREYEKLTGKQI